MDKPLISVIVPVYMVEPYLARCVKSIQNQTYQNLEIILVDDGSPDRSGEMCDAFAREDSRIRVVHTPNRGQAAARNTGLDMMTGEYVGFVDSDDWIEPYMCQRLYERMTEVDAQISACGIQMDHWDGRIAYFNIHYPGDNQVRVYQKMDALRENLQNLRLTYSPCDKLYHKDIFANLRMSEGKIYEDMEILPKCIERAQRVVYDPEPMYHYFLTEKSTIRGTFNPRRLAEADVALEKAEDYRVRYPELYTEAMTCYVSICLVIVHLSYGVPSCAERRKQMIAYLRGDLPKDILNTLQKKDKIKLTALRFSPWAYEMLMRVYDKIKK